MKKSINAVIVDDEQKSCEVLKKMLSQYCPVVLISGIANNLEEAKMLIEDKRPELIFLDVQLPDGNSFTLLEQLTETDFKIIFTTAYHEYALKAFKCSAVDYLLKPINIDELIAAVDKYKHQHDFNFYVSQLKALQENIYQQEKGILKTIGLATVNEIMFVAIESIIRLEAASNYTHFYLDSGEKVTVSHTLKYYEDILTGHNFMRIHQSHIINLAKVRRYIKGKGGFVIMNDGENIDISPRNKENLLRALNSI